MSKISGYNLKTIRQDFKDKGIYHTPRELAELLKSFMPDGIEEVYDPTCGTGSLLSTFPDSVRKYGQDIEQEQVNIATKDLVNFSGVAGDVLREPAFSDKKFRAIVGNPPFSVKWTPPENKNNDPRFADAPTIPSGGRADYAFILHILHHLADDGVAAVLNATGILFRGGREAKIRQWLVENNFIDKVIFIPGKTFVDTSIPTVLLILRKNKITTEIEFEDRETGKSRVVSVDEVKENGYNLNMPRYIDNFETEKEIDLDEVADEMEKIDKDTSELNQEIRSYCEELGIRSVF